jgi:hypothetical protein
LHLGRFGVDDGRSSLAWRSHGCFFFHVLFPGAS